MRLYPENVALKVQLDALVVEVTTAPVALGFAAVDCRPLLRLATEPGTF